ncbi:MAG: HAD family hydrolase [Phycisphaerales bacterium]|nr:HAD family hydrolase [Phycisphaerales bacterium]
MTEKGFGMIDAVLFDLGDTIINFGVGRREAEFLFRKGARLTYDYLAARQHPLAPGSAGGSVGVNADTEAQNPRQSRGLTAKCNCLGGTGGFPSFERYFKVNYRLMSRAYMWSKLIRRDFSYADILYRAAKKLKLSLAEDDLQQLSALWYQPIHEASHIDPDVTHVLSDLRQAGTKLAIVSNTLVPPECLDAHLAREGLLEFFPVRIYSSMVRYRKPHPRIFQLALEQVGVPANRALFIGDLLIADIAGAKRAGMRTIWKPSLHTAPPLFHPSFSLFRRSHRHRPDFTIFRVTELPSVLHLCGWRAAREEVRSQKPEARSFE